jgi:hypothetical protein
MEWNRFCYMSCIILHVHININIKYFIVLLFISLSWIISFDCRFLGFILSAVRSARSAGERHTCLAKNLLRVFLQIFNVLLKKEKLILKIVGIDQASFSFYIIQMRTILFARKEVIINIWPNRDDNNHVLIVTIDVDFGDGQPIRVNVLSHRSQSQSARSVVVL